MKHSGTAYWTLPVSEKMVGPLLQSGLIAYSWRRSDDPSMPQIILEFRNGVAWADGTSFGPDLSARTTSP